MSIDFLPNRAGPEQRAQAANAAAVRRRLFNAPMRVEPLRIPPPRPLSPFHPQRVSAEIDAALDASVEAYAPVEMPAWKQILVMSRRSTGCRLR